MAWDRIGSSFLQGLEYGREAKYRDEIRQRERERYQDEEAIRRKTGSVPGARDADRADGGVVPGASLDPASVSIGAVSAPAAIERRSLMDEQLPPEGTEARELIRGQNNAASLGLTPIGGAGMERLPYSPPADGSGPGMERLPQPVGPGAEQPQMQLLRARGAPGLGAAFSPGGAPISEPTPEVTGASQVALPVERPVLAQTQGGVPAPRTMQPQQFASLRQMNADMEAKKLEAMKRGRPDLALQYHTAGMKLRDQLRGEVGDFYRQKYEATGDPSALIPFINEFIGEGTTLKSIRKIDGPKGAQFQLVGTDDGRAFDRTVSADEMTRYLKILTDPAAQRALEAKQAEDYYKASLEIAKERAKNPYTAAKPGDTLVANDGSGRSVTVPDRRTDRIKTDVKVDDNGDVTVTRVDPLGGDPVIDRIPNMMGGAVPKAVRDLQREAITNIEQFYANPTLPKTDATVNEQSRAMSIAGALVQSNHGETGFAQLNQGNVAELARLIAKGDPSVTVERKMIGGVDTPVRATYRGQQYLLVPRSRLEVARGGGAPAQGSQQQVGGPPLPRAQTGRDERGGPTVRGTIGQSAGVPSAIPPGVRVTRLD